MIIADRAFALYEGSKTLSNVVAVIVDFRYNTTQATYLCEIQPAVVAATTDFHGSYTYLITKAAVDAKTGTGTNPSDKLANQVDQVVLDYLDAITENAAVAFSI